MKLFSAVQIILVSLAAQGCGGGYGCSAEVRILRNSDYTGSYTAIYVPAEEGTKPLTFAFEIEVGPTLRGTVRESGDSGATTIDGQAGDLKAGCSVDGTAVDLTLQNMPNIVGSLWATKSTENTLVGSYQAHISTDKGYSEGTLTVGKVSG